MEVPAKLVLHMLKDKELRGKLQALGLPGDGQRKVGGLGWAHGPGPRAVGVAALSRG